jgi:hypothetical protein
MAFSRKRDRSEALKSAKLHENCSGGRGDIVKLTDNQKDEISAISTSSVSQGCINNLN